MGFTEKAFELAVYFSAVDRLSGPMRSMGASMGAAGQQSEALQKKLNALKTTAFVGGAVTGVGVVIAKGLLDAAEAAGKLDTALNNIGFSTGASKKQLEDLKKAALKISLPTIYTQGDTLSTMQILGAGGINDVNRLKSATKYSTNLAEVTQLQTNGGVGREETVKSFLGMAHQFNLQTDKEMSGFADMLAKIQMTSTAKVPQIAEALKQAAPYMNLLGAKPEDALKSVALMSRMGIEGSMAGTHLKNFYERLTPGLLRGGMANEEMQKLGWLQGAKTHKTSAGKTKVDSWTGDIFHDKQGKVLPFFDIMKKMTDSAKKNKLSYQNLLKPLTHIFGQQGADVAAIISSQTGQESMAKINNSMKKMPGLDKQIKTLRGTYQGQTEALTSNMTNLKTMIGDPIKDMIVNILTPINNLLQKFILFGSAHPNIVKYVATFAAVASAVLLIVGPILILVGAIGFLITSGAGAAVIGGLGLAFTTIIGPVLAVIGVLVGLGALFIHLWNTNKSFKDGVINIWNQVKTGALNIFNAIKINIIKIWNGVKAYFETKLPQIQRIFGVAFHMIKNEVQLVIDIFKLFLIPAFKALYDFVKPSFPVISAAIKLACDVIFSAVEIVFNIFDKVVGVIKTAVEWLGHWNGTDAKSKNLSVTSNIKNGIAGVNPKALTVRSAQGSTTTVNFHTGAITVHATPGQSTKDIAKNVVKEITTQAKNKTYSRGGKWAIAH